MSTGVLDPLIHDPGRLRIIATLAALPDGDTLSVARLRAMIGLPEGSPITHVRELSQAGYLRITKTTGDGTQATGDGTQATVTLTRASRASAIHATSAAEPMRLVRPSLITVVTAPGYDLGRKADVKAAAR